MQDKPVKRKASRFWLYGPTVLLALLAAGWSIGWFVLRGKAEAMIDTQLSREASRGRNWACPGRSIGGFPFRFEVSCATLSLNQGPVSISVGPAKIITQVYDPRHVIIEAAGPMQATDGTVTLNGQWKSLEASIGLRNKGFDRASLVSEQASFTASGLPEIGETSFAAGATSLHIRPAPDGAAEDAYDIAMGATDAIVPLLNSWLGDDQPLQLDSQLTLTRARSFAIRPFTAGLEFWRAQGGVLKLAKLDTRKGVRIFNLKGEIGLDDQHRVQASLQASQANYSDLMAQLTSSGQRRALQPLPPEAAKNPVMALPPVYLIGGKVKIAMFDVPKLRLPPLY